MMMNIITLVVLPFLAVATTAIPVQKCSHVNSAAMLMKEIANEETTCIALAPGRYLTQAGINITRTLRLQGTHSEQTILDGKDNGGYAVVTVWKDARVSLLDLTITGGNNKVIQYPENCASGVQNLGGVLILDRCVVEGNNNQAYGGGVANVLGQLTIANSKVLRNTAGEEGGGLYVEGGVNITEGETEIYNSTISYNSAQAGGGISSLAHLTIVNTTISYNNATGRFMNNEGEGGGVWNTCHMAEDPGNILTLINSTVANNTAALGGGISVFAGKAIITATMVYGNSAVIDPGIRVHQYFHDGQRQTDSSLELHGDSGLFNNMYAGRYP
eukprot:m.32516 g.32516  ORF g.32516 m.32516 type:complete len:330 (-) comp8422_c0_seq1:761-1750(-)